MNAKLTQHLSPNSTRKRHQFTYPLADCLACGAITSIESLREHLQTAIEVEHSTIPPYLCALYSLDQAANSFAYQTIQSVVMEEMLHMILAANILNAIGGSPAMNTIDFVPKYPAYLPHSDKSFLVPLEKFSQHTIDTFLNIELPASKFAPPEADNWQTIGQFYEAIAHALIHFNHTTSGGIFSGDPSLQITEQEYYGGGGKIVTVTDLPSALLAIHEIIGQGEGINGSIFDTDGVVFGEEMEYAHYFKFNEIKCERRYCVTDTPESGPTGPAVVVNWDAVANMKINPKMADYTPGSELRQLSYQFNKTYTCLLDSLHNACNGQKDQLRQAVPLMFDLKYQAQALMQVPLVEGLTAGPSFELVRDELSGTEVS